MFFRKEVKSKIFPQLIGKNPTGTAGTPDGNTLVGYLREHSDPRLRTLHERLKLCKFADCVKNLKKR